MKTINVRSSGMHPVHLVAALIIPILLLGALAGCAPNNASSDVLIHTLSEPLGDAVTAKVDISTDTGNLTIDRLTSGEKVLASGTLQYLESQGLPTRSLTTSNGLATLILKASEAKQTGFRLPWEACMGKTEWQIHLNPNLPSDITAHSGGGNVRLNLAGVAVTRVSADTGGGNMDLILPDNIANLNVTVKTGAGKVTVEIGSITGSNSIIASSGAGDVVVRLPDGIAARVHATSGMGKAIMDPRFSKIDDDTYQTPDYDSAADKVEIIVESGAGNVIIDTRAATSQN